jgi:hypothetical protein
MFATRPLFDKADSTNLQTPASLLVSKSVITPDPATIIAVQDTIYAPS